MYGVPNGTRTRVAALKGRSPRPLDDGDALSERREYRAKTRLSPAHRQGLAASLIDDRPEVPGAHRAVGSPAFGEARELGGLGEVVEFVEDLRALSHPVVAYR